MHRNDKLEYREQCERTHCGGEGADADSRFPVETNDGKADNGHGRDAIIQCAMGVEKSGSYEIELIRFVRVRVTGVGKQQGRNKANRRRNPTGAGTKPVRRKQNFHKLMGGMMHSSKGHAKRVSKKTMPSCKGMV
jgi:hypothetical protein